MYPPGRLHNEQRRSTMPRSTPRSPIALAPDSVPCNAMLPTNADRGGTDGMLPFNDLIGSVNVPSVPAAPVRPRQDINLQWRLFRPSFRLLSFRSAFVRISNGKAPFSSLGSRLYSSNQSTESGGGRGFPAMAKQQQCDEAGTGKRRQQDLYRSLLHMVVAIAGSYAASSGRPR
jgi:hypothetical protein